MEKQIILTGILIFFMYGVLVFALESSPISLFNVDNNNSTNVTNTTIININETNTTLIIPENTNLTNTTEVVITPVDNSHIGSHYTNGYGVANDVQISHGGDKIQTQTNSRSQYTNDYSGSTEQIPNSGDNIQSSTNSKSQYTNGY